MSGSDTSRGMNFQYACAIRFLIDFPLHPEWQTIQMEGDKDIEDVVIFDPEGTVAIRAQIKQKSDPNRWKPYELKAVLSAFSEYKDSNSTTYMFMYSGAEGNEFTQLIKPIVLKLKYEGNQKISRSELRLLEQKLGSEVTAFLLQADNRFSLEKLGTWEDIRQRDLRALRKLVVERSRSRPEEGFEEGIYNRLFVEVAEKTQGASKYFRKLNRATVLDLLQVAEHPITNQIESFGVNVSSWLSYLASVKNAFHKWYIPNELEELVQWNVGPVPINEYIRLKPQFNPSLLTETRQETKGKNLVDLSLAEVLNRKEQRPILIKGSAGAGKSTCLKYWCHGTATRAYEMLEEREELDRIEIPVFVALRRYGRNHLRELIYAQFRFYGLLFAEYAELEDTLERINLTLLLDGMDEVKPEWRTELLNEISVWFDVFPAHKLIVTTRKQPELTTAERFDCYEIQPLSGAAVDAFAKSYLGHNSNTFIKQINERGIQDFIKVPLLLTLCLIIFKLGDSAFSNLAGIYRQIIELYKRNWESPKKDERVSHPFEWIILEKALCFLAYRMAINSIYSVSYQEAHQILGELADQLEKFHLWSRSKHNVFDLLNQLLVHNFVELTTDEITFWHASFRDYFAALYIFALELPLEEACLRAEQKEWALVTAFLGSLLPNTKAIREILVKKSLDNDLSPDAYWPVNVLGLMGNDTTNDIIRIVAKTTDRDVIHEVAEILEERTFEGKAILGDLLSIIFTIEEIYDYGLEDIDPSFPDPDWINFDIFSSLYTDTLLALSTGNILAAREGLTAVHLYLERLVEINASEELDEWLISNDVDGVTSFRLKLRRKDFNESSLRAFCRNTVLSSSLPYLEVILLEVEDPKIRLEANLAVQCIRY